MSKTKNIATESGDKIKLVRDSFTMPKDEYAQIDALKQRAAGQARVVKKSEILRAGIAALAGLSDTALLAALAAVPSLKTGRPKQEAATVTAKPAASKPAKKAVPVKAAAKPATKPAEKKIAKPVPKPASKPAAAPKAKSAPKAAAKKSPTQPVAKKAAPRAAKRA